MLHQSHRRLRPPCWRASSPRIAWKKNANLADSIRKSLHNLQILEVSTPNQYQIFIHHLANSCVKLALNETNQINCSTVQLPPTPKQGLRSESNGRGCWTRISQKVPRAKNLQDFSKGWFGWREAPVSPKVHYKSRAWPGVWLLKHHTGSRSSSLNSFNSHFLDHSTHLKPSKSSPSERDRKVRLSTELQERQTTTLCHKIHVSFQSSLDSHCVATFRYLSSMVLLTIMDVIFRPFRFDNTFSDLVSSSTNSTQSLWFRPWLCQVLASGMRHGSITRCSKSPSLQSPTILSHHPWGRAWSIKSKASWIFAWFLRSIRKSTVFSTVSMYQLQLKSQDLKTCSPTVEERITPCDSCDTFSFLLLPERGSLCLIHCQLQPCGTHSGLPTSNTWHLLFHRISITLNSPSTDLHSWWSLLNQGCSHPNHPICPGTTGIPCGFCVSCALHTWSKMKVLLKEGLSTSRHIFNGFVSAGHLCYQWASKLHSSSRWSSEKPEQKVSDGWFGWEEVDEMPSNLQPSHVTIKPIWLLSVPQLIAFKLA